MDKYTLTPPHTNGAADPAGQAPVLLVAPTHPEYTVVRAAVADLLAVGKLELQAFGMGPASAARLCQSLEARTQLPKGLALIGWAGGLCPTLAAGAIVVGDGSMDLQGESVPCTVIQLAGAHVGPLLTVPEPTMTPQAKSAAWRSGALAVEMEAYPLAVWARARGVPFVHARVVLDTAHEALPDLADGLDPYGRPRVIRLAGRFATRPALAVALFSLARRTRALSPILGKVAREVAEAWLEQEFA